VQRRTPDFRKGPQMRVIRAHDILPSPSAFPDDEKRLLTIPEAAHELRCSKAHLHNIVHGRVPNLPPLPVLRIGRRVLVRFEALKDWMAELEAREIEAQKLTGCFK